MIPPNKSHIKDMNSQPLLFLPIIYLEKAEDGCIAEKTADRFSSHLVRHPWHPCFQIFHIAFRSSDVLDLTGEQADWHWHRFLPAKKVKVVFERASKKKRSNRSYPIPALYYYLPELVMIVSREEMLFNRNLTIFDDFDGDDDDFDQNC